MTNKQIKEIARDLKVEISERFETEDCIEVVLVLDTDGTIGYCDTKNLDRLIYEGFKQLNTYKQYRADNEKITIKEITKKLEKLL